MSCNLVDGINMNKIIKDFNDTKTKSNLSKAEGKI